VVGFGGTKMGVAAALGVVGALFLDSCMLHGRFMI